MATPPSFRDPFPEGLASLHGCFALETDMARINAVANKDRHAPILYMTRLRTRGPCADMRTRALALDKQCHQEQEQGRAPPCTRDHGFEVLARRVCDFYEGEGPGAGGWKDFYLTECDCLKRDHVPPLAEVVTACREKAADQALARQQYNDALAAGADLGSLRRPPISVDTEMCDDLEAGRAVRMASDDRDYFTHLLSRYLTRGLWRESLAKYTGNGGAAAEGPALPSGAPAASLESGYHPHCIYEPCRDAESWTYHVPYSETEDAKGTCKNVALCQARITTQFVRGTVTTRDNVFRVRCDGGANCSDQNFVPRCSGHGLCQPDGSCDCDDGWTGPDCSVEAEPAEEVLPPTTPSAPDEEGKEGAADTAAAVVPQSTDSTADDGTSVVLIALVGFLILAAILTAVTR
jgi:hypothetical protein